MNATSPCRIQSSCIVGSYTDGLRYLHAQLPPERVRRTTRPQTCIHLRLKVAFSLPYSVNALLPILPYLLVEQIASLTSSIVSRTAHLHLARRGVSPHKPPKQKQISHSQPNGCVDSNHQTRGKRFLQQDSLACHTTSRRSCPTCFSQSTQHPQSIILSNCKQSIQYSHDKTQTPKINIKVQSPKTWSNPIRSKATKCRCLG